MTANRMDLAIYGGLAFVGLALVELVYVVARSMQSLDPAAVPAVAGIVWLLAVGMGGAIWLIQRDV